MALPAVVPTPVNDWVTALVLLAAAVVPTVLKPRTVTFAVPVNEPSVAVMVWTPFEEIFKLENVAVPPEAVTVVVPVMPGEATEMLSVW